MNVMIWVNETMLGEGIERLFQEMGIQSIVNLQQGEPENFQIILERYRPNLIIFDEITYNTQPSCICSYLMKEEREVAIIVLNIDNNFLNIINKKQALITNKEDFFASWVINSTHNLKPLIDS